MLVLAACADATGVESSGTAQPPGPRANHTAAPTSVTVASNFQSELGCPGDWQPECATTGLAFDAADGVWQGTWSIPANNYEYKAALNGSWTENYGLNAVPNGATIPLGLSATTVVKFYFDPVTHWITSSHNAVIATVAGSFQSELGCPGDWQPDCLRSWLQDPDGDGTYTFVTTAIPAGPYEAKVAIDESWNENYGAGGVPNGPVIPFTVADSWQAVTFSYDATTHVLTITSAPPPLTIAQQLSALQAAVNALALPKGTTTSLQAKLTDAQAAIAAGETTAACIALQDFANETSAQRGKKILAADADALLAMVSTLRTALGC